MNSLKLDGLYYINNNSYKNAHLVTGNAHNANLGIEHIGLIPVETAKAGAPFFRVNIELTNGILLIGDIFPLRNNTGIYLLMPQDKFKGTDGKTAYIDKVRLPLAVKAQVLRYASQFINTRPIAQTPAPAAQQVAVQTPVAQVPVAAPAPQAPAPVAQAPVAAPVQTNMQQAMNVQDEFLQNQLDEMERNNLI